MSKTLTADELERAYDQSQWAKNMKEVISRFALLGSVAREQIGDPRTVSYGNSTNETIDLYLSSEKEAPVVIFVHGGGWQSGSAKEYGFPAEMLGRHGIHYAVVDFSSVVSADGDLGVLVDQVRRAICWIATNCDDFGGDRHRLFLVGHSSGAHLSAMALSTRWSDYGLPANVFRAGLLASGIYELEPLTHTSRSKQVRLSQESVKAFSPINWIENLGCPVLLAVGSEESPEFKRQSEAYAAAVHASGQKAEMILGSTYNHFDILETLGNPYGLLGRRMLRMVAPHEAVEGTVS